MREPLPDEGAYHEETRGLLEKAYLEADDPRGQSGFSGDEARWERARRPITLAIDRDGTFLDIGCANGLLMESVTRWAGEDGYEIEPYGWILSGPSPRSRADGCRAGRAASSLETR